MTTKPDSAFARMLREHPLAVAIIGLLIAVVGVKVLPDGGTTEGGILVRVFLFVVMFVPVMLVGGSAVAKPSLKGLGFAFRKSAYMLAVAAVGGLASLGFALVSGNSFQPDAGRLVVLTVLDVLFVGLFEEFCFRGVFFGGLVARMGGTRRGLAWAIVISSLVFGFVHVMFPLFTGGVYDFNTAWQALSNTLVKAVPAAIWAVTLLCTRNIWTVVIMHAVNDLMVMLPGALISGSTAVSYVNGGELTVASLITQIIMFAIICGPQLVIAVRAFRTVETPEYGFFTGEWEPRSVFRMKREK